MSTAQLPAAQKAPKSNPQSQPKESKARAKRLPVNANGAAPQDPLATTPKAPRTKANPAKAKSSPTARSKVPTTSAAIQPEGVAADVMVSPAISCPPRASLNEAVRLMWERDLGAVVVVSEENEPVGVITDRDACMAAYTQGVALCDGAVWSAMSKTLVSCRFDASLSEVRALMAEARVRRLPVVDERGRLVGVVGLSDLLTGSRASADKGRKPASGDPTLVPLLDAILQAPQRPGSSTFA